MPTISHRHRHRTPALNSPALPKQPRVCFSYAAYAKNLIHHLRSSNIPVEIGLSDSEFTSIESSFGFTFPPDLRTILREGLPVAPGFPNWRSSSEQQLKILTNLPIRGILKEVSRNGFWTDFWGDKPENVDQAFKMVNDYLKSVPTLVPIYRNFYVPSAPCTAGNPVLYVRGIDVQLWSFDITGFFQRVEIGIGGDALTACNSLYAAPAWAATEARRIEFWTEMVERGERGVTRGWWSGELEECLEGVRGRLIDGGWKEEDVREMMIVDGEDERDRDGRQPLDREHVEARMWVLSRRLLRAGWSREDVVESMGCSLLDWRENGVSNG